MWTCSNLVLNSADDLSAEDLFTEDIVYKKLCMLNVSKSPGVRMYIVWSWTRTRQYTSSFVKKNCADLLAVPLMYIFQKSFQDSSLPDLEISYCDSSV